MALGGGGLDRTITGLGLSFWAFSEVLDALSSPAVGLRSLLSPICSSASVFLLAVVGGFGDTGVRDFGAVGGGAGLVVDVRLSATGRGGSGTSSDVAGETGGSEGVG